MRLNDVQSEHAWSVRRKMDRLRTNKETEHRYRTCLKKEIKKRKELMKHKRNLDIYDQFFKKEICLVIRKILTTKAERVYCYTCSLYAMA